MKRLTRKGSDIFHYGQFNETWTTDKKNIVQYVNGEVGEDKDCCFGGIAIEKLAQFENKIEKYGLSNMEEFSLLLDERDIIARAFELSCQFFIAEKLDGSDQYTVEQAVKEYKYYINLFYKQAVLEIKKVKEDV